VYGEGDRLQGVVSVILDLKQISTFLSTLEVSPSSQIYIIDAGGALVGSSDGKNPVISGENGVHRLAAVDSDTRLVQESAVYLQHHADLKSPAQPQPTSFLLDGDRQFLQITPLDLGGQLDWHIVVVVPESDFMAEMNQQLRLTLWLCLLAGILSTGLSIMIGCWISQPLLQMNQACRALAQGNLDQTVTAKRVYELRELADSFNQMAQQLQGSFTQLQILNQALLNSESRLTQFLEALPVGVAIHNQSGHLTYLNRVGRTLLNMDLSNETLANLPGAIYSAAPNIQQMSYPLAKLPIEQVLAGMRVETEDVEICIDNQTILLEVRATPIFDKQGPISFAIAIFQDITVRKRSEQHLLHNALHDALTGLPNRNLLMERLKLAITRSARSGKAEFALLFLDLDRFKVVNDSLGHLAGDDLLIQVAHRLRETIRPFDVAARLGGDEYVLLLEGISDVSLAVAVAQRVLNVLEQPLTIQGHLVVVTASIGIVVGTPSYTDEAGPLRDADIAMYRAKSRGRAQYEVFNPEMHRSILKRLTVEHDMRLSLYRKDFYLLYQPIIHLNTGKLYGFEVLLRWNHPQHGLIFPNDFIPVAEETGLIIPLGKWVLEQAFRQLIQWQKAVPDRHVSICVNCSAKQLETKSFISWLDDLFTTEVSCQGYINLEITESQLIENITETIDDINRLRTLGCGISIDDFGTGYSSLAYLSQLPVNLLKVDRSFVSQIKSSHDKQSMLEAISALIQPLGMTIVAEGIETLEQLEYLRHLGYQMGQGHFFAKPLSPEDALTFWRSH
ncbi:MAG: EAL domain-containing protein, partial [Elainellaceae cyanobacterium]